MAPRPYNNALRKEVEAETLRRIVTATVALHAEKGATATSHADIAERAGVSVPTVYKYFPTKSALLPHCMGMASRDAPAIDPGAILAAPTRAECLARLVEAVYARHAYFHPWMRWTGADALALPELAQALQEGQAELAALARGVLEKALSCVLPETEMALVQVLLDYCTWQRLSESLGAADDVNCAAATALRRILSPFIESE
ncbi:transcriptional regulator, TetR family [Noviherbaspirillum humi]|uniref:Transcriptional regulator, TetR family n=1 Tax=Noviherbaspirillum humi TaxID=1688639 RepID=A0A239BWL6_9BURK|nr:TetR/AcrR family transcriptional regulator [Noviherbaspirillum humi]SNS11831.1 transcriptional regulator, TetR family [Noviherbaspirillum humi]